MRVFWAAVVFAGLMGFPATASGSEQFKEIRAHTDAEIRNLKAAAEKGDAKAELEYGKALVWMKQNLKGGVTEADYRAWFQKAADQNNGEAWYWLGYTSTDEKLVAVAYPRAAELGFAPAFDVVFEQLLFRAGEKADPAKAKYFLDLAKKRGTKYYENFEGEMERTINACYAAGSAAVPKADAAAIAKDGRANVSFAASDNMVWAQGYANGWGVKRNPKLALALVCHGADVPAELNGMVDTLTKTMHDPALKEPFLFCNHITSGMNGGQCSAFDEGVKDGTRDVALAKITAHFTPEQKTAFDNLRTVTTKYFEEHSGSEQDMSGSARGTFYQDELGRLKDEFLANLSAFEKGKLPKHDTFAAADKALNAVYRDVMKNYNWNEFGDSGGVPRPDGLRTTQRLWLKARDAWGVFGAARYPERTADEWKAWATRQRIKEIRDSFPKD